MKPSGWKLVDWESVGEMIERGFELRYGQHTFGLRGYFAIFIDCTVAVPICDECGVAQGLDWEDSAHHLIFDDAIKMAIKIANGEHVKIPDIEDFE